MRYNTHNSRISLIKYYKKYKCLWSDYNDERMRKDIIKELSSIIGVKPYEVTIYDLNGLRSTKMIGAAQGYDPKIKTRSIKEWLLDRRRKRH